MDAKNDDYTRGMIDTFIKLSGGRSQINIENKMSDLGLIKVWAYHCNRCNYVWLPKDYDHYNDKLANMEPPKSCARCKSKYWNRIPSRFDYEPHSIARDNALERKSDKKQTPEEREFHDKLNKKLIRKFRREQRKKEKDHSLETQVSVY